MLIRPILVAGLALAISQPVYAQNKLTIFKTGNDLFASCGNDLNAPTGLIEFGSCTGYIQAAVDSYLTYRAETNQPSCLATGVTGTQVRDLVTAYLRDNPSERHRTAAVLVIQAIEPLIVPCS